MAVASYRPNTEAMASAAATIHPTRATHCTHVMGFVLPQVRGNVRHTAVSVLSARLVIPINEINKCTRIEREGKTTV